MFIKTKMWWKVPAQYFQIEAPWTCRLAEGITLPNEPARKKEKKKRREREGEMKRKSWSQIKRKETLGHCTSLAIVSLCLRFSFRDPYIDGVFCRFVGHVRNVNYQNATRNDRQIELVGTCWCPVCERKNTARARERRRRQRWESTSENYESS